MAVFTQVSLADLTEWMKQFPIGKPLAVKGIASGIENSNFFLTTEAGEFVLTVFEKLTAEQLPFYLHLMRHLAQRGVSVPAPIANHDGEILHRLHGKPACIVTRLNGACQLAPRPVHCAAVGVMLAKMHLAGQDYPIQQPNLRGLPWMSETTPAVLPYLDGDNAQMLTAELAFQQETAASPEYARLPRGPVHADLFRDNVMFDGERLSGFFDFYFAGCDTWLFDVAVTLNDWCIDLASGAIDDARARALLDSYRQVRPFSADEVKLWQPTLRLAALRFWVSRLYDFHMPRDAQMLTPHDPRHFERILRLRVAGPIPELA